MPGIHHTLLINASVTTVFNAITTEEGLSAWWTPGAAATPEEGSIARFPFGETYFKEMKIAVLNSPAELQWLCIAGAGEWIDTRLFFILREGTKEELLKTHPEIADQAQQKMKDGRATLLLFRHIGWREHTPMYAECSYTWALFLRSLKLYCETGSGTPWPTQHRQAAAYP